MQENFLPLICRWSQYSIGYFPSAKLIRNTVAILVATGTLRQFVLSDSTIRLESTAWERWWPQRTRSQDSMCVPLAYDSVAQAWGKVKKQKEENRQNQKLGHCSVVEPSLICSCNVKLLNKWRKCWVGIYSFLFEGFSIYCWISFMKY